MSITKCLASQNSNAKLNLHETLTHRSHFNLPFNPISCFPITKHTATPLRTSCTRWNSMIIYANVEPTGTPPPPSGSPPSFPITKHTVIPLRTSCTRWNSMIIYANVEPTGTPPPPSGSPSSSWKNWAIGILMTFIVPLVTTKGGPIKLLLQKVDHIVDSAEHITEMVEAMADKVDKVVEELGDELPENSQIKKTLDYIELVAERVEKDAHTAGDFIDKVQEMQDKIEDIMEPVLEEAKEKERKIK